MKCKNCSHEFDGRYCNACGQEIAGRINLKHIWTQIADDIFNIDKGLIYTIKLHKQLFHESWTKTVIKSLTVIYLGQIIYGLTAYMALNLLKAVY